MKYNVLIVGEKLYLNIVHQLKYPKYFRGANEHNRAIENFV